MDKIIEKLKAIVSEFEASKTDGNEIISAEEARKLVELGGRAQWLHPDYPLHDVWLECHHGVTYSDRVIKYRAIKQPEPLDLSNIKGVGRNFEIKPEPVEPHAELKAMYEQQVIDGTLGDFVWEYKNNDGRGWKTCSKDIFWKNEEYRCTPKPTCQIKNLDSGLTETMTREAAKLLQAELGDTVEWSLLQGVCSDPYSGKSTLNFTAPSIYTYKRKANPLKQVSLDPVIREGVISLLNELGVTK